MLNAYYVLNILTDTVNKTVNIINKSLCPHRAYIRVGVKKINKEKANKINDKEC